MKKSVLFLMGMALITTLSFAQTVQKGVAHAGPNSSQVNPQLDESMIFAHVILGIGKSDDKGIFDKVKQYLDNDLSEKINCSFYCMQQRVFCVDLISVQLKDPAELIKNLQQKYPGTDFLIKTNDHILFNECAAEVIKQL